MEWNWITIFGALASLGVFSYVIGTLALFVIPANRKPGEATAWLLLIFLAPVLGAVLSYSNYRHFSRCYTAAAGREIPSVCY